ncbi:hypothetical protein [Nonomuraea sp. NPDC048916]|uniref:hypothetical protein n=1 Tax=Nonomuraea sp. NPDC048916 TaxID=3154232 RepID=UPI0033EBA22E
MTDSGQALARRLRSLRDGSLALLPDDELGPGELEPDDLTTHLVLLGGVDWNDLTTSVIHRLSPSVRQVGDGPEGRYFEAGDARHHPTVRDGRLLEDVAPFHRGLNPLNRGRTLTICQVLDARGTQGADRPPACGDGLAPKCSTGVH